MSRLRDRTAGGRWPGQPGSVPGSPGDAGQGGDVHRRGVQEPGQPGHRLDIDVGLDRAAADAEPPAGEPFRQLAQPGLRDPVEPERFPALDPEPAKLPHIPRKLSFPAAADVQVLQPAVSVAQEGQLPVLAMPGRVVRVEKLAPLFRWPVSQTVKSPSISCAVIHASRARAAIL